MTLQRDPSFAARAVSGPRPFSLISRYEFRTGLLLGSAASVFGTIPALVRVTALGAPLLTAWLALAGGSGLFLGVIVGAARTLRPATHFTKTLLGAVCLCFGPLLVFSRVLWRSTHHRPLGAVTFAFVATAILLSACVLIGRVRTLARAAGSVTAGALHAGLGLACAASLVVGLQRMVQAGVHGNFAAGLLDAACLLGFAALASVIRLPFGMSVRVLGPVVYSLLGVAAAGALRAPDLLRLLLLEAPVPLAAWRWVVSG